VALGGTHGVDDITLSEFSVHAIGRLPRIAVPLGKVADVVGADEVTCG